MSLTCHTNLGDIKIELACSEAPRLAENFIALAASGAYDGTLFHRNVRGFLVQGGDPSGTGKGGESIRGGKLADEFSPVLKHDSRGVVAMASNGPNTGIGCQFYITFARQPTLDSVYCPIGRVLGCEDTLRAIESVPVAGKKYRPVNDITIKSFTIHANPFADAEA